MSTSSAYLFQCRVIGVVFTWFHPRSSWVTASATTVYLNMIHSSGGGFPAARNGSLCAKSQQSDVAFAVHFYRRKWPTLCPRAPLREETSLCWGGDSILALSPCQHLHSRRPTQNEVVSVDETEVVVFFLNPINHILRHVRIFFSFF